MTNELLTIKAGGLTIKADLTATGWNLPEKLTEMEWRNAGCFLVTIDQARQWWLGDWWNACKWGDGKSACEGIGVDYTTAADCGAVARMFEFTRRRVNLTFSHHKEVRPIDDPVMQDKFLDWCLVGADGVPGQKGHRAETGRLTELAQDETLGPGQGKGTP